MNFVCFFCSAWTCVILMVSKRCTMPVVRVRGGSSQPCWRKGWTLTSEGNSIRRH